jgi:hypothetical protein
MQCPSAWDNSPLFPDFGDPYNPSNGRLPYHGYLVEAPAQASTNTKHPFENDAFDWAQKNGIAPNDLLQILTMVSEGNHRLEILPSQINIGPIIDKGSFGSICLADYKGKAVVIKRVSKVIYRTWSHVYSCHNDAPIPCWQTPC